MEAIPIGRFVKKCPGEAVTLTGNAAGLYDGNIYENTPGMCLPTASGDLAMFVSDFCKTNIPSPHYGIDNTSWPNAVYQSRRGFASPNLPINAITVYVTPVEYLLEGTIPSGYSMLYYDKGIFTVTSNDYVADPSWAVGDAVCAEVGTGKAKRWTAANETIVGVVSEINSYNSHMTIETKGL